MKISSSFNNSADVNGQHVSFKGAVPANPKYIPEVVGKLGKVAGEYINTPEQKLFLATSALMFQPLIDLKYAQEDQEIDSAIKSASKAMAGGITGVTIRAAFLKLTKHFIGFQKHNKMNKLFMPYDAVLMRQKDPEMAQLRINQYNQTLGALFAVLFMIFFSNSNIDVPLTSDIQDLISGVVKENKSWLTSLNDVKNNRIKKIKNWFANKVKFFTSIKEKASKVATVINGNDTAKTTKESKQ